MNLGRILTIFLQLLVFLVPLSFAEDFEEGTRYIVKLKDGESTNPFSRKIVRNANVSYLAEELSDADLETRKLKNLGLVVVAGDEYEIEMRLKNHPLVSYSEIEKKWDFAGALDGVDLPSDPNIAPWLPLIGLNNARPNPDVYNSYGDSVLVAVIDTGLNINNPYITSALSINSLEYGTGSGDSDGNQYVDDVYGANVFDRSGNITETGTEHGSHVAGIIKSIRDQAIPDYPEAQKVQILPIRFIDGSGTGTTTGAVMAMEYAMLRGARVVNASWGSLGEEGFSQALYDSMKELYNRDVVMFAAAGNALNSSTPANNNDVIPYFPALFNLPGLMAVGSITPNYNNSNTLLGIEYSSFSNYGPASVQIAAPGSYKTMGSFDFGILSMNAHFTNNFNVFKKMRGTSMATPVVAGIAAVVRAINPGMSNYEVKNLILRNTVAHSALSVVSSRGYAHAGNSFLDASTYHATGARPPVSYPMYYGASSNGRSMASDGASGGKAAGCGMIVDISQNHEGPGGGNSILLVTGLYFIAQFIRRLRRIRMLSF
jgi:subtilisin family serine protease